ncbi:metallophosphoesterase [bacterium]|nr:metallophosphoesterase [bacterium]
MKYGNISKIFVVSVFMTFFSSVLFAGTYIERSGSKEIDFWGPFFFEKGGGDFTAVGAFDCKAATTACDRNLGLKESDIFSGSSGGELIGTLSKLNKVICNDRSCNQERQGIQYIVKHKDSIEQETEKSEIKNIRKWYAISDIHGSLRSFIYLLLAGDVIEWNERESFDKEKHCHFLDEKQVCLDWWRYKWSFDNGRLIIVGDIMDGDDHHNEILWAVRYLERESSGKVHFLLGNHEDGAIVGHREGKRFLDLAAAKTMKANTGFTDITNGYARELFSNKTVLGKWLRSRNMIMRVNNDLFLHGGISPAFALAVKSNPLMRDPRKGNKITLERINKQLKAVYNLQYNPARSKSFEFAVSDVSNDATRVLKPAGQKSQFVYKGPFEGDDEYYISNINLVEDDTALIAKRKLYCDPLIFGKSVCLYNRYYSNLWAFSSPCSPIHYRGYWLKPMLKDPADQQDHYASCAVEGNLLTAEAPMAKADNVLDDEAKMGRYTKILKTLEDMELSGITHVITGHTEEKSGAKPDPGRIGAIPKGKATSETDGPRIFLTDTGISGRHGDKRFDFLGEGLMYDKEGVPNKANTERYFYYRIQPKYATRTEKVYGIKVFDFELPKESGY